MKENNVQNTTIEVNGTIFTMTRPGYYYKKVDGKQKRIGKAEWEQAFDEYIQTASDNADVDKHQTEKTKKPRRSKDIAYEGDGVTLTAKQVDFIRHLPDTNFYENGLESTLWCDILADEIGGQFAGKPMTVGAMISTLREKSLISVMAERINGKKAKYMVFTDLGKQVAKELGLN